MATIGIPHIGIHSHLSAAARIGSVLARRGHRVIAWAPEWACKQVTAGGVEFRLSEPIELRSVMFSPQSLTAAIAEHTVETANDVIQELTDLGVDLVVHDFHVLWARVAADFLGLPRIVSYPMYPGSADRMAPFHPLEDQVRRIPDLMAAIESSVASVEGCRAKIASRWGVDIGSWHEALLSRGETTLLPSLEEITGVVEADAGGLYVGPLLPAGPPRTAERERPLVFASFGTVFNFDPAPFRLIVEALGGTDLDVVLTTGGGPVRPADLEPLPGNVSAVAFVDDVPGLLAGVDLFVSHCGTASVHEALLAGVPIACLPRAIDQLSWARRVAELGAGVIAEPSPAAVRKVVLAILADRDFRERAGELGELLLAFDGDRRVVAVVEALLARAGDPMSARTTPR